MEFTAQQIAAYVQGEIVGNPDVAVTTFTKIEEGVAGAITFLSDLHYEHFLYTTKASVVLVNKDFTPAQPVAATLIKVADARECVGRLLSLYQQALMPPRRGIHPTAVVAETAQVGADVYLGPHVYVGDGARVGNGTQIYAGSVVEERASVGDNCLIYPNVSIYHDCVVGNRVILHSGCCVGADGFGFAPTPEGYEKIPQIGNAVLEDDVEMGANSCVDRAMMGSTIIRRGVKIDNLVQVAHNCVVGSHTVMSAQVGVAGSTKIGQWCTFAGQVGVAGHVEIADQTTTGAQAGIAGPVKKSGRVIIGSPAIDAKKFARSSAVFRNLPEMYAEVNTLRKEVDEMKRELKK